MPMPSRMPFAAFWYSALHYQETQSPAAKDGEIGAALLRMQSPDWMDRILGAVGSYWSAPGDEIGHKPWPLIGRGCREGPQHTASARLGGVPRKTHGRHINSSAH